MFFPLKFDATRSIIEFRLKHEHDIDTVVVIPIVLSLTFITLFIICLYFSRISFNGPKISFKRQQYKINSPRTWFAKEKQNFFCSISFQYYLNLKYYEFLYFCNFLFRIPLHLFHYTSHVLLMRMLTYFFSLFCPTVYKHIIDVILFLWAFVKYSHPIVFFIQVTTLSDWSTI